MAILLIRHGETPLNAERVVQFPDTPLSTSGIAQARRLAERLAAIGVEMVLSSDYLRARMTAEAIVEATGAPVSHTPALRERFMGSLQGRRHADLGLDFHADDFDPPGGENPATFAGRVARAWEEVVRTAAGRDGHTAVVTHGLVCHALAGRHVELAAGAARPAWANTSLTVIEGGPPWRATLVACTAHLQGETAISGAV
jgi:broad specificity phosphatase PhoE